MRPLVIGIAGGTGSGKTTLTAQLVKRFSNQVAVVYHDNYYKSHSGLTYEQREKLNYDSPEAFDTDLLVKQLQQLVAGQSINSPVYDYKIHNRCEDFIKISPKPLIIVEGILIFHFPELRELFKIKLFVDTDADVRILRRVKRDLIERDRSLDSIEKQYLSTVKPMHELYVEPSKREADVIIPEGGQNLVALEMIINQLERHLN